MADPKSLDEILAQADIGKTGKGKGAERDPIRTLTDAHKKMIMALVGNKNQIKIDQETVKDDTKAIAEQLGIKAGDVNKIVSLIIREQEKGGAIEGESNILDLAEQCLGSQGA